MGKRSKMHHRQRAAATHGRSLADKSQPHTVHSGDEIGREEKKRKIVPCRAVASARTPSPKQLTSNHQWLIFGQQRKSERCCFRDNERNAPNEKEMGGEIRMANHERILHANFRGWWQRYFE